MSSLVNSPLRRAIGAFTHLRLHPRKTSPLLAFQGEGFRTHLRHCCYSDLAGKVGESVPVLEHLSWERLERHREKLARSQRIQTRIESFGALEESFEEASLGLEKILAECNKLRTWLRPEHRLHHIRLQGWVIDASQLFAELAAQYELLRNMLRTHCSSEAQGPLQVGLKYLCQREFVLGPFEEIFASNTVITRCISDRAKYERDSPLTLLLSRPIMVPYLTEREGRTKTPILQLVNSGTRLRKAADKVLRVYLRLKDDALVNEYHSTTVRPFDSYELTARVMFSTYNNWRRMRRDHRTNQLAGWRSLWRYANDALLLDVENSKVSLEATFHEIQKLAAEYQWLVDMRLSASQDACAAPEADSTNLVPSTLHPKRTIPDIDVSLFTMLIQDALVNIDQHAQILQAIKALLTSFLSGVPGVPIQPRTKKPDQGRKDSPTVRRLKAEIRRLKADLKADKVRKLP